MAWWALCPFDCTELFTPIVCYEYSFCGSRLSLWWGPLVQSSKKRLTWNSKLRPGPMMKDTTWLLKKTHRIPLGDHQARLELQKEQLNLQAVTDGFLKGQSTPTTFLPLWACSDGLTTLAIFRSPLTLGHVRWIDVSYHWIGRAACIWWWGGLWKILSRFANCWGNCANQWWTHGDRGSFFLHTWGSIKMARAHLMILLVAAVATVESTGPHVNYYFSRSLTKSLNELQDFADHHTLWRFF